MIIGFYCDQNTSNAIEKHLFDYPDTKGEPLVAKAKNINPYLVAADDVLVNSRNTPLNAVPSLIYGNKIVDGGFFLFTEKEKAEFLKKEPNAKKYLKEIISGEEFLSNKKRFCLWLKDADPSELKKLPEILKRIENVKEFRLKSTKATTRAKAQIPSQFAEYRQPTSDFLIIPRTSSENRKYIPFAFFTKNYIVNDSCTALPNCSPFHFGILTSEMHMCWVKYVCGRLKSDFRYSNNLVYNNFPWPQDLPKQKIQGVEKLAQQVLKVRERYPKSSLADLYDPLTMPADLVKAHQDLDKFVDTCYRAQPFDTEMQRIEFLFDLYKQYTQPLFGSEKKKKGKK